MVTEDRGRPKRVKAEDGDRKLEFGEHTMQYMHDVL